MRLDEERVVESQSYDLPANLYIGDFLLSHESGGSFFLFVSYFKS